MKQMMKILPRGLSFDDVLLQPARSDITSRWSKQLNLATRVARGAPEIHIPILSSNMDTVTEASMAITMALLGGLGVIHRFLPIDVQAATVKRVKDRIRILEEDPPKIRSTATISQALELLALRERGYIIVYDESEFNGNFSVLSTPRDFDVATGNTALKFVMTPKDRLKTLQLGAKLTDAVKFMKQNRLEKIPVIDKKGKLVGIYALKDVWYREHHPDASLDARGRLMAAAAIGVKESDAARAKALTQAGADVLVIDIAHGELNYTARMLKHLKSLKLTTPVIAGNVATATGAQYLQENGALGIKVGIGPGYVCETRDVAGVGVPQITAIMEVARALGPRRTIPIIADGGIRKPADLAKALAAGADSVMIGSLFAGTDESPGERIFIDGVLKKMVRGMASSSAFEKRMQLGDSTTDANRYTPEGRTTFTPYKGSVVNVVTKLIGGLRSSMSYVGAHTIKQMHEKGIFRMVSPAGLGEQSRPLG